MTPSIRVGFVEDFNGADTLLIDLSPDGLPQLIEWFRGVSMSAELLALNKLSDVSVRAGLVVRLQPRKCRTSPEPDGEFVWLG